MSKWIIAVAFAIVAVFSIYTVVTISIESAESVERREIEDKKREPEVEYRSEYNRLLSEAKIITDDLAAAHQKHVANFGFDETDRTFYEPEYAGIPDRMQAVIDELGTLDPPTGKEAELQTTIEKLEEVHETIENTYRLIRKEYMGMPDGDTHETSSFLQATHVQRLMNELR